MQQKNSWADPSATGQLTHSYMLLVWLPGLWSLYTLISLGLAWMFSCDGSPPMEYHPPKRIFCWLFQMMSSPIHFQRSNGQVLTENCFFFFFKMRFTCPCWEFFKCYLFSPSSKPKKKKCWKHLGKCFPVLLWIHILCMAWFCVPTDNEATSQNIS